MNRNNFGHVSIVFEYDMMIYGRFATLTVRRLDVLPPVVDVSPPGRFATRTIRPLDVSLPGRFTPWTFCPLDDSPPGHFAHMLHPHATDDSPPKIVVLIGN